MRKPSKERSLAFLDPELAKEWDYEKNYPLMPEDFARYSNKKAWWKCKNKHIWEATISHRSNGSGCPCCSGRKVHSGNCLATVNFKLAKEWNYKKNKEITPKDIVAGSHKKVWWKCKKGHEWLAIIKSRNSGRGCPYCNGKKVYKDNCLATMNPKLSKEWNYNKNGKLTPESMFCHSNKKVWWKCSNGHEYNATVGNRSSGSSCPYCAGQKVNLDNCLAILNPILAQEWHPTKNGKFTPYDVTCGSGKKVWWKCKKGHEYSATVSNKGKGTHCPYCSGNKACKDNCLATLNPKLTKEWHPIKNGKFTPYDVTCGMRKKVWWKCKKGHEWLANICDRRRGSGCPYCHKIELKNGTILDSLPEAYYYLKLKNKKVKFKNHVSIGFGRYTCDFYIPSANKYIEVSGFTKKWTHWKEYYKNILKKKKHITKKLKANFEFVQIKLTSKQTQYVRANAI